MRTRGLGVLAIAALGAACAGAGHPQVGPRAGSADHPSAGVESASASLPRGRNALAPKLVFGVSALPAVEGSATVLFAADDSVVAIGEASGLIRVFDARTGEPLEALRGHAGGVTRLAAAPGGAFVSGDEHGELTLWTPGARGFLDAVPELLASRHQAAISSVSFSADGHVMVTADSDGNAFAWDMTAHKITAQLDESEDSGDGVTVGRGRAASYAVLADGKRAIGWSAVGVFVMSLADRKIEKTLHVGGSVVVVSAEGDGFAVTYWERTGAKRRASFDAHAKRTSTVNVGSADEWPIGSDHVLRREDGRFVLVSNATKRSNVDLPATDQATVVVSSSGKRALLASGARTTLIDVDAGTSSLAPGDRLGPVQAILEVDGELVAADGAHVGIFDRATGKAKGELPLPATKLVASADGKRWGGTGSRGFLVEAATREILFEAEAESVDVLSPDLGTLARRVVEGVDLVATTGARTPLAHIALPNRDAMLLAFSPDGRALLVVDRAGKVERFDVPSGKRSGSSETKRAMTALVGWDEHGIFTAGQKAGGSATLVRLDSKSLAITDESPKGQAIARASGGAWVAWITKDGVHVKKDGGATYTLPDRLGVATALAFDAAGKTLYAGRWGAVEAWPLDALAASSEGANVAEVKPLLPPPAPASKTDAFGDPLPAHSLQRFGTLRGIQQGEIEDIVVRGSDLWLIGNWGRAVSWDRKAGRPIKRVESEGTAGDLNAFVTPDGKSIVARGTTSLGQWSVGSGERTATVERKDTRDSASALSPKGDRFVVGTETGDLLFYAVPGLTLQRTVSGAHHGQVDAIAFSPNGKLLASCGHGSALRISNASTGAEVKTVTSTNEYGCSVVGFTADSTTVLTDMQGLEAYDASSGRLLGSIADEGNRSQLAFSPSGDIVAIGHFSDPVTIWDTKTRKLVAKVAPPDDGPALAFSADGRELYVAGREGILRSFDTAKWSEIDPRPVNGEISEMALADQGRVLVTADLSGTVRAWDTSSGAILASRLFEDYPSLAVSSTGVLVDAHGLYAVDPRTLKDRQPPTDVAGQRVSVSADGAKAVFLGDHAIDILDVASKKSTPVEWGGGYLDAAAIDPRGRFVVAGGTNGAVRFFDTTGADLGGGRAGASVHCIEYSPTEDVVFVCAGSEGSEPVYVALELPSGKQRWRADQLAFSASEALAVSADGRFVAFADEEGFHFLSAKTGVEVATLPTDRGGSTYVNTRALAFSPDGKTLYASDDRTVSAWDTSFIR